MQPRIATLAERMSAGGDWMEFREEIAELHALAATQGEFIELLQAHAILGLLADHAFDEETAAKIKNVHQAEYLNFLSHEAMEGGDLVNPAMLAHIVEREVEAGRLDPDDDYRQFALAGKQVLGDAAYINARPSRMGNWVALIFAIVAVALWALSIRPFEISALWLIVIGLIAGTIINSRESTQISHAAELARAKRGY